MGVVERESADGTKFYDVEVQIGGKTTTLKRFDDKIAAARFRARWRKRHGYGPSKPPPKKRGRRSSPSDSPRPKRQRGQRASPSPGATPERPAAEAAARSHPGTDDGVEDAAPFASCWDADSVAAPAPPDADVESEMRRLYLDGIGKLVDGEEVKAFVAAKDVVALDSLPTGELARLLTATNSKSELPALPEHLTPLTALVAPREALRRIKSGEWTSEMGPMVTRPDSESDALGITRPPWHSFADVLTKSGEKRKIKPGAMLKCADLNGISKGDRRAGRLFCDSAGPRAASLHSHRSASRPTGSSASSPGRPRSGSTCSIASTRRRRATSSARWATRPSRACRPRCARPTSPSRWRACGRAGGAPRRGRASSLERVSAPAPSAEKG